MSQPHLHRIADEFAQMRLTEENRPMRLRLEGRLAELDQALLIHSAQLTESVNGGISGHLTCLAMRDDLPAKGFIGLAVELQIVTDVGELRRIAAIVSGVQVGQSDGSLTVVQLTVSDAVQVMAQRINTRVFRRRSALAVALHLIEEWRQRSGVMGRAFGVDVSLISQGNYPEREFIMQTNESDAAFVQRLLRHAGISWYFRTAQGGTNDDMPRHEMVLFDDSYALPVNPASPLRYHRDDATEARDSIFLWSSARQLVSGSVVRHSWDYKTANMLTREQGSVADQGAQGNELAALLRDAVIEMPHAGDSTAHHHGLVKRRLQHHEMQAKCIHGASGVRELRCGQYFELSGHHRLDQRPQPERCYTVLEVVHEAQNNLPKALDESAQELLKASAPLAGWQAVPIKKDKEDRRYTNRFKAVRRDTPIVPLWNPDEDLPLTHPLTAIVTAPEGEEVHTDALGRVKVRFLGLDPVDHAHASGAGTTGFHDDSAWVRVGFGWAGNGWGHIQPLRAGMEVEVDFEAGQPDRPVITRVLFNGHNPPPRFSHQGELPGNRYLSGTKTKEIKGQRYNQLRFDDTPGQISGQLASEHAHSQLNLGHLTHPRTEGQGEPRGEGAELRTDESLSLRAAKALLISTWQRLDAKGGQLDRDEYLALMQDSLNLFKSLGEYAAEHQGLKLDAESQAALGGHIQNWEAGSNTAPKADPSTGGQPVIGLSAKAGISAATPQTILNYAGVNIDSVAKQHLQSVAGQRYSVTAGKGIGLFAQSSGITAIAHQGPMSLQSQHDDTLIDSAKNVQVRAVDDIVLSAKQITLIAHDGSFIRIGNGIELGTQSQIAQKAAGFPHSGPATLSASPPEFAKGATDQQFVAGYGGTHLPAGLTEFAAELTDGSVLQGAATAQGDTPLFSPQSVQGAKIKIMGGD